VKGDIVFKSCSEVADDQLRCYKLSARCDGEVQWSSTVLLTTVVQQSVKEDAASLLVIKWRMIVFPKLNRLEHYHVYFPMG
jgi:hypothetical protein